jgi:hypothetical protein
MTRCIAARSRQSRLGSRKVSQVQAWPGSERSKRRLMMTGLFKAANEYGQQVRLLSRIHTKIRSQ